MYWSINVWEIAYDISHICFLLCKQIKDFLEVNVLLPVVFELILFSDALLPYVNWTMTQLILYLSHSTDSAELQRLLYHSRLHQRQDLSEEHARLYLPRVSLLPHHQNQRTSSTSDQYHTWWWISCHRHDRGLCHPYREAYGWWAKPTQVSV